MKIPKEKPKLLRSVHNILEFGKHKGKTILQVMGEDPQWLHWALQNIPDFKLNHNALVRLPPFISRDARTDLDQYGDEIPNTSYDLP